MTYSPVRYDGHRFVTKVSHVQSENEISIPEYVDPEWSCLHGNIEYSLSPYDKILRVHDLDDNETYVVHTVEDWEGLDMSAVQALRDAVNGVIDPGDIRIQ